MNFFEKELKRIMDHSSATYGHTYVGSTYYGTIDDDIRAKVNFRAGKVSSEYDRICVTILNRASGKLDGSNK